MVKLFKSESAKHQVVTSYNRLLEMWSVDFEEMDVETKYGMTHCIISGNVMNPPLLLFHGVGDNSAVMWVLNMKELSKHFYCIAVDTMGGPGKSVPNSLFTKQSFNQVDWISQIVDHFKLEKVFLAGVSNGAYMAYNYATMNSDRVAKVVCMEGGMVTKPLKSMIQTLLIMFPEIIIPTQTNMLKILKKLSSPGTDLFDTYPLIAEHLILVMKSHNQQAMFAHKLEKYDKAKGIAIREKIYFLIGGHKLTLKKDLMSILDEGEYRYKVIPHAGHGINHEQPEIVNSELIRFLLEKEV